MKINASQFDQIAPELTPGQVNDLLNEKGYLDDVSRGFRYLRESLERHSHIFEREFENEEGDWEKGWIVVSFDDKTAAPTADYFAW